MKRDAHLSIPTSIDTSPVHPLRMRCTRWFSVLTVMVSVLSGWRIYSAALFFPFTIPAPATLGGWLGGMFQWHFVAMRLLVVSDLAYLAMNVASGRLTRKFFPVTSAGVRYDMVVVLKGGLSHADPRHYDSMQRLAYLLAISDIVLLVFSGLILQKSVQFATL